MFLSHLTSTSLGEYFFLQLGLSRRCASEVSSPQVFLWRKHICLPPLVNFWIFPGPRLLGVLCWFFSKMNSEWKAGMPGNVQLTNCLLTMHEVLKFPSQHCAAETTLSAVLLSINSDSLHSFVPFPAQAPGKRTFKVGLKKWFCRRWLGFNWHKLPLTLSRSCFIYCTLLW